MRHNTPQEFLGVDVGSARVGIARGSSLARLAEPLKTVSTQEVIAELKTLAADHLAAAVVVGLPRNLEGNDTAQTQLIRDWVSEAKNHINLPFFWQDEALTTVKAESIGVNNHSVDAQAAAIILQDFLDTPEAERVRC